MPEYILTVLILAAIMLACAIPLGVMSYRGYRGSWRRFLVMQPPLIPVGRYWGLLTSAVLALLVIWACGTTMLSILPRTGSWTGQHSFWLVTVPVIVLVAAAYLFSWWLPRAWRPGWLREQDRGTRHDPMARSHRHPDAH
ncbi:hypothetical protein [Paeniglutamicibacter cryotolerans]|uniref:Uncharacterized protein n=1 Tax=Paeniglutamicibacter cryotolerans TaxID=670079 RepID=A0A839QEE2_9MICC|nr:hypothetical protein [Paeniglutamicibacter cryotolerans]MBB2994628.1 hypothetical protein [Paeniglutamicibacter cryotolerans]